MHGRVLFLGLTMMAVSLAGCADDPPSGEFSGSGADFGIEGSASITVMPPENQYPIQQGEICTLDAVTEPVNDGVSGGGGPDGLLPICTDAYSAASAQLTAAPMAASGYTLWMNGTEPLQVGTFVEDANGTLAVMGEYPGQDWTGVYSSVDVMSGSLVVASAPAGGGAFTPADPGVSISGSWEGATLSITISGVPQGVGTTAQLIDSSGLAAVSASVSGSGELEGEMDIDEYAAIRVVVAGTGLILAQAAL